MWARVDDGWWCHPKTLGVSLAARGLWISVLSWSGGQRQANVPDGIVRMFGGTNELAGELVAAGFWDPTDGGWTIHNWEKYQQLSTSEKRAEAGRKGGEASGKQRRSKAEASGEAGIPVPVPVPDPKTSSSSQDNSQPDDDFDWPKVWRLIAEWKRTQQPNPVADGWVKTTARNQPLDDFGGGMSFAERGRTWLEFFDIDEATMAELLTGRRHAVHLKRRAA